MKSSLKLTALLCAFAMMLQFVLIAPVAAAPAAPEVEATVQSAVAEEKIPIYEDTSYSFAERAADLVARMSVSQKGSQMISSPAPAINAKDLGGGALNTVATKNLPSYYWWNEGLHGYNRVDNGASAAGNVGPANSVSYPQSLTVGSTWNPALYYQEALQVSDEIRERTGVNSQTGNAKDLNFYSPTINLQRDPRWGRNEESYSEDVYLTSKMGAQYVLGLEGKNQDGTMIDPNGYYKVHSTIKHYVANNSESNRLNGGAVSDLDALRNYYVQPYRNIIKATDVTSVMTAYSTFNGEPCSFSSYLMDTLLRQTFGLSGYITSDCDAVGTMTRHNYVNPHTGATLTSVELVCGALAHGEDLECNGGYASSFGNYSSLSTRMVEGKVETDKGLFTENSMDVSLHRLLTGRISTGELDDNLALTAAAKERVAAQKAAVAGLSSNAQNVYNQTPERLAIVDAVNNEGVVMLQNNGLLPLNIPTTGEFKVVIVGAWQTNMYLGLYSANASNTTNQINIQKGITDAIKAVNPNATFSYITSNTISNADQATIAAADVAVAVAGANNSYSAEDRDRSSIALPNNLASMIAQVGQLNPNTIAVLETCGPVQVTQFQNNVKAILWSSFGGLHKGVGFGNIITGAVNPSGHLTATWYQNDSDMPAIRNYNMYATNGDSGRTYMYYQGKNAPSYVFGYGLSFTSFAYSNLKIDKAAYDANDTVKVTFDVTNTGAVAGKDVAQLYIAQPDAPAELLRPIRRLEGFEKIELQPGETKTVSMEVSIPDLAFYSEAAGCFAVDTGKYQVQVGEDSAHANLTADFTVSGKMDVYPEILTVKANQEGDTEARIEQRLIFDLGKTVNPQITVAMNDESLYGYIIADQKSPIKQMKSCALPEGMTFTYESNRPSVVAVEGDKITTVGAGVATITVTGTLGEHTVTTDFVVYVTANAKLTGIEINGETYAKFDADKHSYTVTLENNKMPTVTATGEVGCEVTVEMPDSLPGVATITSTHTQAQVSETYTINFKVKPKTTGASVTVDFTNPDDASKFEIVNQKNAAIKEGDGLTLTSSRPAFEPCNGQNSGDQATIPEDVVVVPVGGDWEATLEFTFSTASARNGYYQFFGFYAAMGDDFQNLAGIRGGDGALQNFLRVDGEITADSSDLNSAPGLNTNGATYWFRITKSGTTYTCARSSDGDEFTDMFTYEDTGIEADSIVIDAYTGMTAGYQFNLKTLEVISDAVPLPSIDFTNPEDAAKFEVLGQNTAAIVEGTGLTLTSTRNAIEPCNGQNNGDQANTPEDIVSVPVGGDWTATLEFVFSTGSARNGYYQFFGMYAAMGDDFQNLAGIRGGDGALQNFLRVDGELTADSSDLNSAPGLKNNGGTYWYQITKEGDTYICSRSDDGDEFTEMFRYEDTGIEADSIIIDAYTGMTAGYQFTLKSLEFEGGSASPVKEKPEISMLTVNGGEFGFNADTKIYNIEVPKDSTETPVIAAVAGNKSTVVTIEQLDGPFGTATVTGTVGNKSVVYSISFNYGPQDDYFADGDMSDNWTILHEVKDATADRPWAYYRMEQGTGLVLPTQKGSIYMAKQADPKGPWTNVFTMPAQGNWEVVIKSFYPEMPKDIYQQTQVFAWQDEDHYIRINCQYNAQRNLRVEPANEVGSGTFNILNVTYATPNADNTATLYYKLRKDGTTYNVSYSTDCVNWVDGGTVQGLDYVDPKIGLFCTQDDGNDNWIELSFEYVAVTWLNGVEQKTYEQVLEWGAQNAADYIAAALPETTSENLTLAKAPHGYTVSLISSDPSVIAEDGTVTPAAADKDVTLTVVVTEGETQVSATATVTVPGTGSTEQPELAIVTEPVDFTGSIGETAKFCVEVNRTDVTYQWLWSKDGGKTWNVSDQAGFDTAEVSVQLKAFRNGQMYKVVVTDSTGATVESAAVKMSTPTAGLKIVENPANVKVAVNQAATFTVKAEGEGLTYQWMYSNNGGSYWSVSTADGATTASMSITGKAFRNGQMYKCVVTDASGNVVESAPATMTVG